MGGLHLVDLLKRRLRRRFGELVREKEIARVAVAYILRFVAPSDAADILEENDLHGDCGVWIYILIRPKFYCTVELAAAVAGGSGVPLISSFTISRAFAIWGSWPAATSASVIGTT